MLVIVPNDTFERAVNAAFMTPKNGGEIKLAFEAGAIELVLREDSSEEKIELRDGDIIHFFHDRPLVTSRTAKVDPGNRLRNHYIISFGNHGSLSVDARDSRDKRITLNRENDYVTPVRPLRYLSRID